MNRPQVIDVTPDMRRRRYRPERREPETLSATVAERVIEKQMQRVERDENRPE